MVLSKLLKMIDCVAFFWKVLLKIGRVDNTLFQKECNRDFLSVQAYVDDIIFSAHNESLY